MFICIQRNGLKNRHVFSAVKFNSFKNQRKLRHLSVLNVKIASANEHKSSSLTINPHRYISNHSDYGEFAAPGKIESFYQWLTDTHWLQAFENYLTTVHDSLGIPWWSSIIVCTILLRASIMTPLLVSQMKNTVKYQQFSPMIGKLQEALSKEVEETAKLKNWDQKTKLMQFNANYQRHKLMLFKKYKIPGMFKRYMLPWVQIPIWISMSVALRHLTLNLHFNSPVKETLFAVAKQMSEQGCLWFHNLCMCDPYLILPVVMCLANLAVIEISLGDGKRKLEGLHKFLIYVVRFLSVVMVPVACHMPSGVVLYWLCSSSYGVAQALALRSLRVKKILKIPVHPMESTTPYRDILSRLPFAKFKEPK